MEKGSCQVMKNTTLKRIVITGAESTGKTTLASQLAAYYNTVYIPEYAREYVENLKRPYNYEDIEKIAFRQIQQEEDFIKKANNYLFYDTYLIITKVWFQVVYNNCPDWLLKTIVKSKINLFLICDTDIPWEPDPVRENGGKSRNILYQQYIRELEEYHFNYKIVNGLGKDRLLHAIHFIEETFFD